MTFQTSPLRSNDSVAPLYSPQSSSSPDSSRSLYSSYSTTRFNFDELSLNSFSVNTTSNTVRSASSDSLSSESTTSSHTMTRARKRKLSTTTQREDSPATSSESSLEERVARLERQLQEANKKIAEETKKREFNEFYLILTMQAMINQMKQLEAGHKIVTKLAKISLEHEKLINILARVSIAQTKNFKELDPFIRFVSAGGLANAVTAAKRSDSPTT